MNLMSIFLLPQLNQSINSFICTGNSGVALSEIAVLYRTGAQSEPVEQALSEAGIGLLVRGGARFFQRAEVRRAMVALRGAMRTERAELTSDLGRDVRYVLGREGWTEQAPAQRGAVRERWDSLNAIVDLADELARVRNASGTTFGDKWLL